MPNKITLSSSFAEIHQGKRLDQALALIFPEYSRSLLTNWLKCGNILIDGKVLRAKEKVKGNESVMLNAELTEKTNDIAQAMKLDVIYEDEAILIINKPTGLTVHPGAGMHDGTLLNALLYHDQNLKAVPRAGIVHRLDKDTTGLLVVAKTLAAHTFLVSQLKEHQVTREYEAIVKGVLTAGGTISKPIGRDPHHRTKMAVVKQGKEAITNIRVLEKFNAYTRIRATLQTGRTHQIRVHMASIGAPLVGDDLYGGRLRLPKGASDEIITTIRNFKRQALHARHLGLVHPVTKLKCDFEAPLPQDIHELLRVLRQDMEDSF